MINTYGILWEQIKGGEEVFWFKKKGGKPKAAIFVDYEHWYYGYRNNFQMKPNIEEWLKELEDEYEISRLYIFGDFSKYNIGMDLERLKSLTKNVIHTASEKDGVDKDFTDVIMLDAIYRSVADKENEEVYVSCDGAEEQQLPAGATVVITKSDLSVQLVEFQPGDQFRAIDEKLRGR